MHLYFYLKITLNRLWISLTELICNSGNNTKSRNRIRHTGFTNRTKDILNLSKCIYFDGMWRNKYVIGQRTFFLFWNMHVVNIDNTIWALSILIEPLYRGSNQNIAICPYEIQMSSSWRCGIRDIYFRFQCCRQRFYSCTAWDSVSESKRIVLNRFLHSWFRPKPIPATMIIIMGP